MPPKSFNPPRPTTNAAGSKPRGRPKGSTNTPSSTTKRKSTGTIAGPSKPKTAPRANGKGKGQDVDADTSRTSGLSRPRVSNASTVLDISSGDEEEEDGYVDRDIEMGTGSDSQGGREEEDPDDDDDDPFSSQPLPVAAARRKSTHNSNRTPTDGDLEVNAGEGAAPTGRHLSIPPDLINVLMHGFFNHDNTRMSRDANAVVGRYIETFVREALNRAAWAKRHGWEEGLDGNVNSAAGEGGAGDGEYLEVEDLERLAPQLLLDL